MLRSSLHLAGKRALVAAAVLAALASMALAQPPSKAALATVAVSGPDWAQLSPAQRAALAPLQRDWDRLGPDHRQKWLELAARYPKMPEGERARMQARMADWARLSPQERGRARLGYQQAQKVGPQERQAKWEAYQALPADQRRQFAAPVPAAGDGGRKAERRDSREEARARPYLVPNHSYAVPPKAVAPTVVQAKPGATTNLISNPAAPPSHQQTGLPKITVTPGFVDRTTLLPQRGPQGAATRLPKSPAVPDDNARQ